VTGGDARSLSLIVPGPLDQLTGGYLYARRLVDGLRAQGHTVAVYELAGRFPDADDAARAAVGAALAGLDDGAIAVIDGLALAGCAGRLSAEARRARLLALVHHPLALETGLSPEESRRFAEVEARLLPLFRGVVCPSAETAQAVARLGVAAARIAVVPPGTDKPRLPPARPRHDGPLSLLSVASVTPRKGHAVLVAALAMLAEKPWRLTIIGSLTRDKACAAALRQAIAAHDLAERIDLVGERPPEALTEAYAAADIFVLPSYHEGYGMVLAEAMAHGLPIVATQGGAIPELVPPSAGLLVPPGDAPALADALRRVVDNAALRAKFTAGAAEAARALPSWNETVRAWLAAIDRLVA
jgi:glycosyltransferase involved in cell wall biosynthesis